MIESNALFYIIRNVIIRGKNADTSTNSGFIYIIIIVTFTFIIAANV